MISTRLLFMKKSLFSTSYVSMENFELTRRNVALHKTSTCPTENSRKRLKWWLFFFLKGVFSYTIVDGHVSSVRKSLYQKISWRNRNIFIHHFPWYPRRSNRLTTKTKRDSSYFILRSVSVRLEKKNITILIKKRKRSFIQQNYVSIDSLSWINLHDWTHFFLFSILALWRGSIHHMSQEVSTSFKYI